MRSAIAAAIVGAAIALAAALLPAAALAQAPGGDDCLTATPPAPTAPPQRINYGITPLLAGTAGEQQSGVAPEDNVAAGAALERLRGEGRELVLRLNRMFWSDGAAGIHHYARIVDRYARAGFDTELQVRYHPPAGMEGNMAAWTAYVRQAARILGRRPSVRALSITNEANFAVSPNTSDGSYDGVREAVVDGIVAADRELRKIGRGDVKLGFSFAWRWIPSSDRSFWEEIGARATPAFRRALDYVGLQIYPGLVFPPAPLPGRSAGDEIAEPLYLMRDCYMPKAGLGEEVELWVTENGYATNLGRSPASQRTDLASTLAAVHAYSGELGVSDYRYFNLRDNDSDGTDLFDAVGLLADDYTPKPAFATFADAIHRNGAPPPLLPACNGKPVTLIGSPGRDGLRGTPHADVIAGLGGRDRILGDGGRDVICGGAGGDRLNGGPGADRLLGQAGRDRCRRDGDWLSACEAPLADAR